MPPKRTNNPIAQHDEKKLLERITQRYEQLDEKLDELESKFADLGIEQDGKAFQPAKPR
jgi:hypothetical protein